MSEESASTGTSIEIEVPSVDKRSYKHFTLSSLSVPNNTTDYGSMDVLLISDPDCDKASGACDVHVGQLCDPSHSPGISHFLEHMLFIGTSKYPTENAYDQYLSTHGGSSNAFTDLEHTCYYFDVQADSLEGALDRFAQCFIGPLFTQSALEREIMAVDSEHAKNLQQDMWRCYQLSKSRMVKDTHPFASFGSGNQKSLPVLNIREKLLEYYQRHYRRNLSLYKLVVLGKESIDDLEAMVRRYFTDLVEQFLELTTNPSTHPAGDGERKEDERSAILDEFFPTLLDQLQLPQRLHVIPIAETHSVELQFPLREIHSLYQCKPTRYLSHLIGHEGKGSLLSLLKSHHYAQELYADDSSKSCRGFSVFTIRVDLTEKGVANVNDVIRMVFAYIDLLKTSGPQDWVQEELETVAKLTFRFLSQRNPMDYTCSIAGWMQNYPPQHYLSGAYKVYSYDPEKVTECLSFLRPDNMLVMVCSQTFAGTTTQTEPWYGTEYEVIPMEESLLQTWSDSKYTDHVDLQLPERNDMVATDFELKPSSNDIPKDKPQCILEKYPDDATDGNWTSRLWYKPDNVFEMPKVNMLFHIHTRSYESPETHVMTQLWGELLREQCNEFTYLASMAGLHCDFSSSHTGVELHVSGYHHKAHVLLQRIVDTIFDDERNVVTQELFDRIHDKISEQYKCFLVASPYRHAMYGSDLCLEYVQWTIQDKMNALKRTTLQDVESFMKRRLFSKCSLEGLVHGNVSVDDAKKLSDIVLDKLKPSPDPHPMESRVIQLVPSKIVDGSSSTSCSYLYQFEEFNESDTNSCLEMVFQMGSMEYPENACLAFLHHLMREPAFNQLRTEEQLGYLVHTSVKTSGNNIKGLLFLIQSDSFDPIHMEERVEAFLTTFRQKFIVQLTGEQFQHNIDAVVANFLEKSKNLGEESSRYWHVILNQSYQFTRLQDIAEHVKGLTKERVLRFFDRYLAPKAPCRRKLCVHVFAKQHQERMGQKANLDGVDPDSVAMITDPVEFKRTMPVFPLPKRPEVNVASFP